MEHSGSIIYLSGYPPQGLDIRKAHRIVHGVPARWLVGLIRCCIAPQQLALAMVEAVVIGDGGGGGDWRRE